MSELGRGAWRSVARQQTAIAGIGQLGLQGVPLDEILERAQRSVTEVLEANTVAIFDWHEVEDELTLRAAMHQSEPVPAEHFDGIRLPGGTRSLVGYTVIVDQVVRSDDLVSDERFDAQARDFDSPSGAALTAPIGWGGKPVGVLGAWTEAPRAWSDENLVFIESMANTLGLILFRTAAELAREEDATRLEMALEASNLGVFDWSPSTGRVWFGSDAAALLGIEADGHDMSEDILLELLLPEDRAVLREDAGRAVESTGRFNTRVRVQTNRAGNRWFEVWGRVIASTPVESSERNAGVDPSGARHRVDRVVGVLADITEQQRAEEQMERSLTIERNARYQADRARRISSTLAEASEHFHRSLDSTDVLDALSEFCAPFLADLCIVHLLDSDEAGGEVSAAHGEDLSPPRVEALREGFRAPDAEAMLMDWQKVALTGTGQLVTGVVDGDAAAPDSQLLDLHRRAGVVSAISVPLRDRGLGVGSLSLLTCRESGRRLDEDDLVLAQQLADRAVLSWDNARLYESRNRVVRSLQAALLPPALPRIRSLELAAKYEVAGSDLEIGGDFYDVKQLAKNDWAMIIGDVRGRGPDAAAVTGLVRHSIRAAVIGRTKPSEILALTNEAMLHQLDDDNFSTVAFVRLHLTRSGKVRLWASSAGHPCPIVVRADGEAELLDCAGTLLGVVGHPQLEDVRTVLGAGDMVILYTDGITESRRCGEFFGEDRLLETASSLAGGTAEGVAEGLIEAVTAFAPRSGDDRAILVARVVGGERSLN